MATRLYPNTDSPRVLEHLAGVPEGTFKKLEKMENETQFDEDSKWKHIQTDPVCAILDNFLTFGWGRICYVPEGHDYTSGSVKREELVREMARKHGIEQHADLLVETGGLHWS